ncbi:hypothetical protein EON73_04770 [bacterium]|nr:MAG: hypothetical protein EON73_04770 [bacterium]
MTTFEIKQHIEINESYQGINLTEFSILTDNSTSNDQIVETFIHSNLFSIDSLRDVIKYNSENKPYLRRAFNIDRINISDFKKKSKLETSTFLYNFLNEPDWGDDRNDFAKLLDKYLKIHTTLGGNNFYIISKEWFDKGDERVIEPVWLIYSYYFLIISIDRSSNLLTLTEWAYD